MREGAQATGISAHKTQKKHPSISQSVDAPKAAKGTHANFFPCVWPNNTPFLY
jgi:hypothetical protein